jgi:hypothetical protein
MFSSFRYRCEAIEEVMDLVAELEEDVDKVARRLQCVIPSKLLGLRVLTYNSGDRMIIDL